MKKEKKISKEKVDSYINKIKAEVKEREKRYGSNKIMKTASRIETNVNVGLEKSYHGLKSAAKEKVVSRQVLKKNSMVVNVPDFVAPSILGDENRFFRGELNKEKRSLYFG